MQALLELRALQTEEDIQQMLRGGGVARGQISLEQIQPGGWTVALGVVAWGDELDDRGDVAGGAEIAGDGDEHIGAVSGGREQRLVEGERARKVAGIEAFAGGDENGGDG